MLTDFNVVNTLLANGESGQGGGSMMTILIFVVLPLMVFMMFRASRKNKQQAAERRNNLVPGAEVMTTAGIFGRVLTVDLDNNKVELEVGPGNTMTFHVQAIANIVTPDEPVVEEPAAEETVVEEDIDTVTTDDENRDDNSNR